MLKLTHLITAARRVNGSLLAVLLLVGLVSTPLTFAQDIAETAQETAGERPVQEQVPVEKLDAEQAKAIFDVLATLYGQRGRNVDVSLQYQGGANTITLRGSKEDVETATKVIAHLETLLAPAKQHVKVFQLQNAAADAVAETVSRIYGDSKSMRLAVDERINSLIVYGPEDNLAVVEALIAKMDSTTDRPAAQPATPARQTLQVRVIWLTSSAPAEGGKLPPNMENVVAELETLGIGNLSTVGQAVVKSLPDQQFALTVRSSLQEKPVELRVQGSIEMEEEEPLVQLQLQGNINEPAPQQGGFGQAQQSLVNVNSTIRAPLGHYVVLGVTPTDLAPDAKLTSIFVLQITGQ